MVSTTLLATILAVSGSSNASLLYFTADRCPACQSTKPAVQRLVEAGYPVREIAVDRETDLAARFRVNAVPCFVMLVDNREIDRVSEATSYARLVQMFDRIGASPSVPVASAAAPSNGAGTDLVRGQSGERGAGVGLPRPLAALARNFGQRREPVEQLVQVEAGPPAAAPPTRPSPVASPVMPATAEMPNRTIPDVPVPGPQSPKSTQLIGEDVHVRALQATVRMRVDDLNGHSVGTGTIIDTYNNESLIVTCGHIFRDSSGRGRIAVDVFANGRPQTVNGTLINYDLERDLALVAIPAPANIAPARVAPAGFRFERGQGVFSVGCNRGADPTVMDSRITGIDRYVGPPNLEIAGQPVEGRSGGGLFSSSGELIGVCNAADQSDNEGIFASLPAIHWELDRVGQKRIYSPKETELAQQTPRQPESVPNRVPVSPTTSIASQPPRPAVAIQPAGGATPIGMPLSTPMGDDTEVICIVRSRANPQGSEKLLVLDRPSRELLDRLTNESRGRSLTELSPQSNGAAARTALNGSMGPATSPSQPIVRAQLKDR